MPLNPAPPDLIGAPEFLAAPGISELADRPRWTVSGRLGEAGGATRKAPLNIRALLDEGRLSGAWCTDERCLVTLPELFARLPAAANAACYLVADLDDLVVLDVEPDCPVEVSANLRGLPGILYAEVSMSGRGYHLLMRPPSNLPGFPDAAHKRVLRESHGWYEMLRTHWVTFTRRPVPDDAPPVVGAPFATLEDVAADLASQVSVSAAGRAADVAADDAPPTAAESGIADLVAVRARPWLRTPADFDHDTSRWEFSVLGSLWGQLQTVLSDRAQADRSELPEAPERARLLYLAAQKVLPHRDKHDTLRNGRPYLLDRAAALVADRLADDTGP